MTALPLGMTVVALLAIAGVVFLTTAERRRHVDPLPIVQLRSGIGNIAEEIAVVARFRYRGEDLTERINLSPLGWRPYRYGFIYAYTLTLIVPRDIDNPADIELVLDWFDIDDLVSIRPFTAVGRVERGDTCTVTQLDFAIAELKGPQP